MVMARKLLVPLDLADPDRRVGGFLCPNVADKEIRSFFEISSGEEWAAGMVVFIGVEISKHDLLEKISNSVRAIISLDHLLESIDEYLGQLEAFRIGDFIAIQATPRGFELLKLKKGERANKISSRLPQ